MAAGKVIVGGVSIILVVGVVIGVVASVSRSGGHEKDELSKSSKAVQAICKPTDYQQQCVHSLNKVANNQSATPQDFIQAAIEAIIEQIKVTAQQAQGVGNKGDGREKMAAEDCKDLLDFAIQELQASYSTVGDSQMHSITERVNDLKNWFTSVLAYSTSCVDGFSNPDLQKEMMNKGMLNATQLTSNALAIVSALNEIFGEFNIPLNTTASNSRRLLETEEEDDKYPSWMPGADRKLLASGKNTGLQPNAVVAQDGSGQFKTISDALAAYPKNFQGRYVIYVKAGIYKEYVIVNKNQQNILMYGDGPRKTIVTGNKGYTDGITTYKTATFTVLGNGFIGKSMGFQNTGGPDKHQAVALLCSAEKAAFYNCRIDAYQDTLYTQANRQFYRNCVISGTVDFIFGDAPVIIQNCLIIVRLPGKGQKNAVTAQGRSDKRAISGIIIQNCRIVPEAKLFPQRFQVQTFLGRPWKPFSRTVFMENTIGDFIQPAGWLAWDTQNTGSDTCYYREYANRGPGAVTNQRVKWKGVGVITDRKEAEQFTVGPFIQGNDWLPATGAPFILGFTH